MTNKEVKKAVLAEVEGDALYLGSTLVWKRGIEDDFDAFAPEQSQNRLVEPTTSAYGILHNTDDNSSRLWFLQSATTLEDGILKPSTRPKSQGETFNRNYVASLVYSKKMFEKGRLDIRAKFTAKNSVKCSLWCMTTPATESLTNLSYVHEYDIVEYKKDSFGLHNTSRGMWTWQANEQSKVPATRLPFSYTDPDTGVVHYYTYDSWTWNGSQNGWVWANTGRVFRDGNILVGHENRKRYKITNTDRGVVINSSNLTWEREDGATGTGLDGNTYFDVPSTRVKIGGGEVTSALLNGTIDMRGWHTWSIVFGGDYVAYQCDGQEYYRQTNDHLCGCVITDDMKFSIIFSVINVNDPTNEVDPDTGEVDDGRGTMEVDWIKFVPACVM